MILPTYSSEDTGESFLVHADLNIGNILVSGGMYYRYY